MAGSTELRMNLADHLPQLTVFALCLMLTLTLPRVMERFRLPGPIGFILAGIILGPQVLGASARTARSSSSLPTWGSCF